MAEPLEAAVTDLKAKISERISVLQQNEDWREVLRLYGGLGVLEELCHMPKTELTSLLGLDASNTPAVGKYEFAGQPPLEAAKKYLRKIAAQQKAASLDEIIAGLEKGGLTGVKRDELRISLSRSTFEIYKVSDDVYGLVENFPHIKRVAPKRKGTQAAAAQADAVETGS